MIVTCRDVGARLTQHQGLPVAGYRPQTDEKISIVNANKILEERCLRQMDAMMLAAPEAGYDLRMLALARTGLQESFMWLNRAVFQPIRVALPEDAAEPQAIEQVSP